MARKLIVEVIGDSRSLERAFARSSKATDRFGRDIGQAGRGVVAVSGLFAGLGRQVAFASSAFLGGAGLTKVLTDSIREASEATKTQRQLAAQFRANGQDLRLYQKQISETSTRVSQLAGIQDEELTQAFTNAFRGTKDVTAALKVESVAADVARGRNIALSTAGIALTKAYLGQTTALKRLGIQIPANVKGMEALELVGRRFAGQAAAGTTAQERLSVAISETEETIGKVLLPTVTKIANEITKWLNTEENQQRIQRDVRTGVKLLTEAFSALKDIIGALKGVFDGLNAITGSTKTTLKLLFATLVAFKALEIAGRITRVAEAVKLLGTNAKGTIGILRGLPAALAFASAGATVGATAGLASKPAGPLKISSGVGDIVTYQDPVDGRFHMVRMRAGESPEQAARRDMKSRPGFVPASRLRGQSLADRRPGRGPGGAGAFQPITPGGLGDRSGPLGILARMAKADLARAKALSTKTQADDRAALEVQKALVQEAINSNKKVFRDKAALYRQLASIQSDIQAIDDEAHQRQVDAAEKAAAKAKAAREKAADIAKKERERERAARKKAHDIAVRAAKEARDAAKQAAREFRDLIQTERERIGELFSGPVFNPTEAQRQRALGFRDPGANARTLVADLKAQIQQFKDFERDLQKLAKRGAPPQLLQELRQQGLAVAPQVHALATAGAGTFAQFKSLFIQRERLAVQAAKQARPVVNLTVIVNKDTGHVSVKTTPHGQPRGRSPGVVINQGAVIN